MKRLTVISLLIMFAAVGNAQTPVGSFPYFYDWTAGAAFVLQGDGHAYLDGGDGNWGCFRVGGTTPGWVVTPTNVYSNVKGAYDTLLVRIDATGKSFSGSEVFTFTASRGGGTMTGTLTVYVNETLILSKDISTDLSTAPTSFSAPLPASAGNSVFTVYIVVNSNKNGVVIDNTGISGGVLPITLSWFKVDFLTDSPVLTWETISEIDNYGFYIQKSKDMVTWTEIPNSFQEGHGTTVETHSYSFTDYTLPAGAYYRLHQVDLDGTSHYSEPRSVVASVEPATVAKELALRQNYPNPFNPVTTIKYTVGGAGVEGRGARVKLAIYDLLGREVAVLVNEAKAAGNYDVTFDGHGLSSGVYYYRLTAGNFAETKRMVMIK